MSGNLGSFLHVKTYRANDKRLVSPYCANTMPRTRVMRIKNIIN